MRVNWLGSRLGTSFTWLSEDTANALTCIPTM